MTQPVSNELYKNLRWIHIGSVIASGSFFGLRSFWMLSRNPLLQKTATAIIRDLVDTSLLCSAVGLAMYTKQYPWPANNYEPWLTAKIVGLVAFVGLGSIGLKRGKTSQIRNMALVGAITSFGFIVATARNRDPNPMNWSRSVWF